MAHNRLHSKFLEANAETKDIAWREGVPQKGLISLQYRSGCGMLPNPQPKSPPSSMAAPLLSLSIQALRPRPGSGEHLAQLQSGGAARRVTGARAHCFEMTWGRTMLREDVLASSSMRWSCRGAAYQKWIALCSVQAVEGSTAGGGSIFILYTTFFSSEGGDISLLRTKVGAKGAGAKDGAKGIRAGVLLTKVIAYVVCSAWFAATLPNTVFSPVPRTAVSPVLRAFSRKIWQEIAQHTVENIATRKHLAGVGDHSLDIVCGIGHPSVYLVDCGHEVVVLEVCHELMGEPIMERDDCKITCGYLLVKDRKHWNDPISNTWPSFSKIAALHRHSQNVWAGNPEADDIGALPQVDGKRLNGPGWKRPLDEMISYQGSLLAFLCEIRLCKNRLEAQSSVLAIDSLLYLGKRVLSTPTTSEEESTINTVAANLHVNCSLCFGFHQALELRSHSMNAKLIKGWGMEGYGYGSTRGRPMGDLCTFLLIFNIARWCSGPPMIKLESVTLRTENPSMDFPEEGVEQQWKGIILGPHKDLEPMELNIVYEEIIAVCNKVGQSAFWENQRF
ncbi:hypothetical protein B0H14DRAFT_2634865 [Mycena olivaceomarginata]|nr:hypothetical protein B0H14DRAFT_2634865 [Mycena olivaceomarginata]